MSPSKARANEVQRTPTVNDIFDSGHLQRDSKRLDMQRKNVISDKLNENSPS